MAWKVSVDKGKCSGCGACESVCPENFKLGEDGKSHPVKDVIDEVGCVQDAVDSCPVGAISLERKD